MCQAVKRKMLQDGIAGITGEELKKSMKEEWITLAGLAVLMIPCMMTDLIRMELPVRFIIIFAAAGTAVSILLHRLSAAGMITGAGAGLVFFGISHAVKGNVGRGDCFLILALGIWCGGIRTLVYVTAAAALAGVFGAVYMIIRKCPFQTRLPFAPFLGLVSFCSQILCMTGG